MIQRGDVLSRIESCSFDKLSSEAKQEKLRAGGNAWVEVLAKGATEETDNGLEVQGGTVKDVTVEYIIDNCRAHISVKLCIKPLCN